MRNSIVALLFTCLFPSLSQAAEPRSFISGSMAEIKATQSDKPMVVNFWSIDCPPCYKELAMWKELGEKYPELNLVLISTDDQSVSQSVSQTLQEKGVAHFPSWQFAASHTQRLRYEIDKRWFGELPRTYFYAPTGESTGVSGLIEKEKVEQWLAQYYPTTN